VVVKEIPNLTGVIAIPFFKYLLFTPGPVNVAENVRSAIGKEGICHRESDFDDLLLSVENKVL